MTGVRGLARVGNLLKKGLKRAMIRLVRSRVCIVIHDSGWRRETQ